MKNTTVIFVTGGVCSSLGKGVTASSLGALMECYGYKVNMVKMDPYINIDAGTMSPFQHGEVYVTDDGMEADLDLGNYERFTHSKVSKFNSITTGQIYQSVIEKERSGSYLGKCVQVIPHITGEIIDRLTQSIDKYIDFQIVEIGGTVGDIEAIPFLEAARQFSLENSNCVFLHLTLIPTIGHSREIKTKPTQHSVQKLREIGIQPDILLCRLDQSLPEEAKQKISLFTNVNSDNVIEAKNVSNIYKIPLDYELQGLTRAIFKKVGIDPPAPDLSKWERLNSIIDQDKREVTIGVVGKYIELEDSYKSVYQSLYHAGFNNLVDIKVEKIDSNKICSTNYNEIFSPLNGILVPGGFGKRGIEGKILAAKYARENKIPYFGICLGMQIMAIEFARNVLQYQGANSSEFDKDTSYPIISLIEEQRAMQDKGGTMRLGNYQSNILKGSLLSDIYNSTSLNERHRHRYEFNKEYIKDFEKHNIKINSYSETPNGKLVEGIEWTDHPFGIGVQFHPEFKSNPFDSHPIFRYFIKKALETVLEFEVE